MSLTYQQAEQLLPEIQCTMKQAICRQIFAISPRTFILECEREGKVSFLLICLQEALLRFHLCATPINKPVHSLFASTLQSTVKGMIITDCTLLGDDRILQIDLKLENTCFKLIVEFFPKRPNFYLIANGFQILTSLNPVVEKVYQQPEKPTNFKNDRSFDQLDVITNASIATYYMALEAEHVFQQKYRSVITIIKKQLKKSERKLSERQQILEQCAAWNQIQDKGLLIQANLFRLHKGMDRIIVQDWNQENLSLELTLDPLVEPNLQAKKYFQQARKLRLGIPHAERQIQFAMSEVEQEKKRLLMLEHIPDLKALESFCKLNGLQDLSTQNSSSKKTDDQVKVYRTYKSTSGLELWVGKNAKANDQLTFRYANGSDWWLHARDCPGSHVIIKAMKGAEPAVCDVLDAAELALRFSKLKDEVQGEVCFTQVKFLKRMKGAPGQVMLSKHKVLSVKKDEQRWLRLKNS